MYLRLLHHFLLISVLILSTTLQVAVVGACTIQGGKSQAYTTFDTYGQKRALCPDVPGCTGYECACADATITDCSIVDCLGKDSCRGAKISNSATVICHEENSCREASISGAELIQCDGRASCFRSTLSLSNFGVVNCGALSACMDAVITGDRTDRYSSELRCTEGSSCKNTVVSNFGKSERKVVKISCTVL
jgi:hypothetical protein